MVHPTPPDRAWNTWHAEQPAALLHVPSDFVLGVSAFSGRHGRWHPLTMGDEVELGRHELDGSRVELQASVTGTRLSIEYRKPDPWTVIGSVRVLDLAELPLRFWILISCGFLSRVAAGSPEGTVLDGDDPPEALEDVVVEGRWRSQHFATATDPRPAAAGRHEDLASAGRELETHGYVRPPTWDRSGRLVVLRFNAELSPEVRVAVAQATDRPTARAAAWEALDGRVRADQVSRAIPTVGIGTRTTVTDAPPRRDDSGHAGPAEAAIRDVLAWNTVWDAHNRRWYTTLSRRWAAGRFGGWLMWVNDCLYHALMAARIGDADLAEHNLDAVLHAQQPAGNLPCLLSGYTEWVDRSHPPIGAWIVWRTYLLTGNAGLLERAYPVLRRWHSWWFAHRDGNANGLLEYGSSPTGQGLYAHTPLAARNESSMDNSPMFDGARFDRERHTLDLEEVGLNSLLVLDAQMLSRMAEALGHADDAAALQRGAQRQAEAVRERLWDAQRGVFAGRHWDGRFTEHITPTSFYPLVAGIATREQADTMVRDHLLDERSFWGRHVLPATPYHDPVSNDDTYWRGRVWPPLNLIVHEGLRRYGYRDEARVLAERGWELFRDPWERARRCMESFHRDDPGAHAGSDVDDFYTWGALLPLILLLDGADASPWDGVCIGPGMRLPSGAGRLRMAVDDRAAILQRPGCPRVRISPARCLAHVQTTSTHVGFVIRDTGPPIEVALLDGGAESVVAWHVDHRPVSPAPDGVRITVEPDAGGGTQIDVHLRPGHPASSASARDRVLES